MGVDVDEWEVEAAHNPKPHRGVIIWECCEKVMGIADGDFDSADERISLADTLHTLAI